MIILLVWIIMTLITLALLAKLQASGLINGGAYGLFPPVVQVILAMAWFFTLPCILLYCIQRFFVKLFGGEND